MFVDAGGDWLQQEIDYLERQHAPRDLEKCLREDIVGRPRLRLRRYVTSHNRVHHLYHLTRYQEATGKDLSQVDVALEWGGGYGGFARLFRRLRRCTYILADVPAMSALQWLYLSSVLGPDEVNLMTGPESAIADGKINLLPSGLIAQAPAADFFISTWALSESTPAAEEYVEERDWFGADRLLLAFSEGTLGPRATRAGASIEPLRVLPRNEYAFR
jgi:hypothetical protein